MAKKKTQKGLISQLALAALVVSIISSVVLLFDAFKVTAFNKDYLINGLKAAFGGKQDGITFKFNILLVVALVLPIGAGVVQLLIDNKFGSLITIVALIVSVVLLFTAKVKVDALITTVEPTVKLATFGIISVITSVIAMLVTGYKLYLQL